MSADGVNQKESFNRDSFFYIQISLNLDTIQGRSEYRSET